MEPHDLYKQLVNVIHIGKTSFIIMGKILSKLKEEDGYKLAIGEGAITWEDFLRQPEIGLSTGEANRLVQIYDQFIVRLGYDEDTISKISTKNIYYLLPIVKKIDHKEDADELVEDATLLSQKDFKRLIEEVKNDGQEIVYTFEYMIMKKNKEIGTLDRVPGITSDQIKLMFNL